MSTHQATAKEWYLASLKKFSEDNQKNFQSIRQNAKEAFSQMEFPNRRHEDWKYFNVAPILKQQFELAKKVTISKENIAPFLFPEVTETVIVFVNGIFNQELSNFPTQAGIYVANLAEATEKHSSLLEEHLGKYTRQQETFTALNTAFIKEGSFIYIKPEVVLEKPIHLLYLATGQENFVANPRNLFVFDKNCQAHIIQSHHSLNCEQYFYNSVSEIVLAPGAKVRHLKIQQESQKSHNISTRELHLQRDSAYKAIDIDLGGALVRNNVNVALANENCEAHLYGFYMGNGTQVIDNHTFIDHAKPHCHSDELYKGILDDKAQGVFNGKVMVRQDAQKTLAFQSNQNILLSENASINTKPQLEIFADDVRCSHGATIGELDEEALFYLQTRGVSREEAQMILRQAFASKVLNAISLESIRERIETMVEQKFNNNRALKAT